MQCSRNSRLIEAPRFWATPAALNAAGFPVGRKPAVRGDGTQTTTQRTLKRKAKRHIRCEAKRASRRGAREAPKPYDPIPNDAGRWREAGRGREGRDALCVVVSTFADTGDAFANFVLSFANWRVT